MLSAQSESYSPEIAAEEQDHEGVKLYRVPDFLSSRMNWVPPLPLSQASVSPQASGMWVGGGATHSLAGKGVGGPNSDDWTETLVLYIILLQYNPTRRKTP